MHKRTAGKMTAQFNVFNLYSQKSEMTIYAFILWLSFIDDEMARLHGKVYSDEN